MILQVKAKDSFSLIKTSSRENLENKKDVVKEISKSEFEKVLRCNAQIIMNCCCWFFINNPEVDKKVDNNKYNVLDSLHEIVEIRRNFKEVFYHIIGMNVDNSILLRILSEMQYNISKGLKYCTAIKEKYDTHFTHKGKKGRKIKIDRVLNIFNTKRYSAKERKQKLVKILKNRKNKIIDFIGDTIKEDIKFQDLKKTLIESVRQPFQNNKVASLLEEYSKKINGEEFEKKSKISKKRKKPDENTFDEYDHIEKILKTFKETYLILDDFQKSVFNAKIRKKVNAIKKHFERDREINEIYKIKKESVFSERSEVTVDSVKVNRRKGKGKLSYPKGSFERIEEVFFTGTNKKAPIMALKEIKNFDTNLITEYSKKHKDYFCGTSHSSYFFKEVLPKKNAVIVSKSQKDNMRRLLKYCKKQNPSQIRLVGSTYEKNFKSVTEKKVCFGKKEHFGKKEYFGDKKIQDYLGIKSKYTIDKIRKSKCYINFVIMDYDKKEIEYVYESRFKERLDEVLEKARKNEITTVDLYPVEFVTRRRYVIENKKKVYIIPELLLKRNNVNSEDCKYVSSGKKRLEEANTIVKVMTNCSYKDIDFILTHYDNEENSKKLVIEIIIKRGKIIDLMKKNCNDNDIIEIGIGRKRSLKTLIANELNIDCYYLVDDDILKFYEWRTHGYCEFDETCKRAFIFLRKVYDHEYNKSYGEKKEDIKKCVGNIRNYLKKKHKFKDGRVRKYEKKKNVIDPQNLLHNGEKLDNFFDDIKYYENWINHPEEFCNKYVASPVLKLKEKFTDDVQKVLDIENSKSKKEAKFTENKDTIKKILNDTIKKLNEEIIHLFKLCHCNVGQASSYSAFHKDYKETRRREKYSNKDEMFVIESRQHKYLCQYPPTTHCISSGRYQLIFVRTKVTKKILHVPDEYFWERPFPSENRRALLKRIPTNGEIHKFSEDGFVAMTRGMKYDDSYYNFQLLLNGVSGVTCYFFAHEERKTKSLIDDSNCERDMNFSTLKTNNYSPEKMKSKKKKKKLTEKRKKKLNNKNKELLVKLESRLKNDKNLIQADQIELSKNYLKGSYVNFHNFYFLLKRIIDPDTGEIDSKKIKQNFQSQIDPILHVLNYLFLNVINFIVLNKLIITEKVLTKRAPLVLNSILETLLEKKKIYFIPGLSSIKKENNQYKFTYNNCGYNERLIKYISESLTMESTVLKAFLICFEGYQSRKRKHDNEFEELELDVPDIKKVKLFGEFYEEVKFEDEDIMDVDT